MNQETTIQFIREHATDDVRMLALHKNRYPDVDMEFAIQQIEGKQRTKDKLPEIYALEGWHYPIRLSLEQCSSEITAKYKVSILKTYQHLPFQTFTDLTGGFGIDTFYLSELFKVTHYVERNVALCEIAKHNFSLIKRNIIVHNADAACVLQNTEYGIQDIDVIYLDPARRSASGNKVFRLQDCEPDLTQLYPLLMRKCKVLMVKLSPMLDITEALRSLPDAKEVHIIARKNEVKEILILCCKEGESRRCHTSSLLAEPKRIAANLDTNDTPFIFTAEEENNCQLPIINHQLHIDSTPIFLYEPNAAILKAGAFQSVGARYNLSKLAMNTHLYASDCLIKDFPGRIFQVLGTPDKTQLKALQKTGAHTICRNYPISADKLAAKHKIKEGGTLYLIGTHIATKNILLLAERIQ